MTVEELFSKVDSFKDDKRNKVVVIATHTDTNQVFFDIEDDRFSTVQMLAAVMLEEEKFATCVMAAVESYFSSKGKDIDLMKILDGEGTEISGIGELSE